MCKGYVQASGIYSRRAPSSPRVARAGVPPEGWSAAKPRRASGDSLRRPAGVTRGRRATKDGDHGAGVATVVAAAARRSSVTRRGSGGKPRLDAVIADGTVKLRAVRIVLGSTVRRRVGARGGVAPGDEAGRRLRRRVVGGVRVVRTTSSRFPPPYSLASPSTVPRRGVSSYLLSRSTAAAAVSTAAAAASSSSPLPSCAPVSDDNTDSRDATRGSVCSDPNRAPVRGDSVDRSEATLATLPAGLGCQRASHADRGSSSSMYEWHNMSSDASVATDEVADDADARRLRSPDACTAFIAPPPPL